MTRADQQLRDQRVIARVRAMPRRNLPKVAREFDISRRSVERILQLSAQREAQP